MDHDLQVVIARPEHFKVIVTQDQHGNYIFQLSDGKHTKQVSHEVIHERYLNAGYIGHQDTYVQNMHVERALLGERIGKLAAVIGTSFFFELDDEDRSLLECQLDAMTAYRQFLDQRISRCADKQI